MELKEAAYKTTEIGILPNDWEVVELEEIGSFKNGINKDKHSFGFGSPFVNLMDVFGVPILSGYEEFALVNSTKSEQELYNLQKGDVLFVRSSVKPSGVGLTCLIPKDLPNTVFSGFLIRFRDNGKLNDEFKRHCFYQEKFRYRVIASSTVSANTNINQDSLKKLKLALPPSLEEQKAIATALSDVDTLITNLDKLIAKKKAIKQGTMQRLLKSPAQGGQRLPGFEGEWEQKLIGDFARVVAGGTPSTLIQEYWNGDIPWMNSGELNLKFVYDVENRITDSGVKFSSTQLVPANCVLIGLAGQGKTRGTAAINLIPLCTNQSIAAIIPNDSYSSLFLYYFMDLQYHELRKLSTGDGGRGGLNLTIIRNVSVPFPVNMNEQKAIATILFDMDKEIESLEIKKSKYLSIKQGMMQELLTGKTRLV